MVGIFCGKNPKKLMKLLDYTNIIVKLNVYYGSEKSSIYYGERSTYYGIVNRSTYYCKS